MKNKAFRISFFALAAALVTACSEAPPPTLSYKEREMIDSLYRHQVDSLKPIFDSICTARFDSAVHFKTDSMVKVRNAEIQKALEQLRKETNQ